MMPQSWSAAEVEATVRDYMEMLSLELHGRPFNKRERNERLRRQLDERSQGAVEFKHQNISAVLIELGMPYIAGYKPRRNVQKRLREAVRKHVSSAHLQRLVERDVEAKAAPIDVNDPLGILVEPPQRRSDPLVVRDKEWALPSGSELVDYLLREERNRSLGDAGEALVLKYEQARLRKAGRDHLARNVEQVSKTVGDRAGYDIHSYEKDGRDRFVEVKTTRYGKFTPFFISAPEVRFSEENAGKYHLYRLFEYRDNPGLFVLPGDICTHVHLQATTYRARF